MAVLYFNKKDLIKFGKYLLSEKREESIRLTSEIYSNIPLEERLRMVHHADIENFLDELKQTE